MTADPLVQPAEVCAMQAMLGASISFTVFFILLKLSRKMPGTRCLSISQRSASPLLPVLRAPMVGHTGDSKTPDDEENPDPLPLR